MPEQGERESPVRGNNRLVKGVEMRRLKPREKGLRWYGRQEQVFRRARQLRRKCARMFKMQVRLRGHRKHSVLDCLRALAAQKVLLHRPGRR